MLSCSFFSGVLGFAFLQRGLLTGVEAVDGAVASLSAGASVAGAGGAGAFIAGVAGPRLGVDGWPLLRTLRGVPGVSQLANVLTGQTQQCCKC